MHYLGSKVAGTLRVPFVRNVAGTLRVPSALELPANVPSEILYASERTSADLRSGATRHSELDQLEACPTKRRAGVPVLRYRALTQT